MPSKKGNSKGKAPATVGAPPPTGPSLPAKLAAKATTSSKRRIDSSDEEEDEDEDEDEGEGDADPSMNFFNFMPSGLVDDDSLPSTQIVPSSSQPVCLIYFRCDIRLSLITV